MTQLKYYHYDFSAMGSPCSIQLYARHEKKVKYAAKLVIDDVYRLEAKYSRYRTDSFLSDINRIAKQGGHIGVDDETACAAGFAQLSWQFKGSHPYASILDRDWFNSGGYAADAASTWFKITRGFCQADFLQDEGMVPKKLLIRNLKGCINSQAALISMY